MRVTDLWTPASPVALNDAATLRAAPMVAHHLVRAAAACNNAELDREAPERATGDPTEIALLNAATALGDDVDHGARLAKRRAQFHFDPALRLMSTIDDVDGHRWVHTKGAPRRCSPGAPRSRLRTARRSR
ncbi:hypothetical protein ACFQX7_29680 [Luedemannella flava]